MNQNPKSATTAGLLGIFLGGFGAHNWYLGDKKKGIIHVCMMGAGLFVELLANIILPNVLTWSALLTWAAILGLLGSIAGLAMGASSIWGLVEGIMILSQGDAGLAAKGYAVANPQAMNMNQGYYGQPAQGYQGQPMNQPMNQPMPGQPTQPMGQPTPTEPTNQGMNSDGWNNQNNMGGMQNGQ